MNHHFFLIGYRGSIIAFLCAMAFSHGAVSGTIVNASGANEIYAGAGNSNPTIDTVNFNVPGANVGDGVAIAGGENGVPNQTSLIDARARSPGNVSRTVFWVVDSSAPLVCSTPATCGSTTIALSKIRWTTPAGSEIPSGQFSGAANQALYSFQTSRYVYTYQTFYFANDEIYPAGNYSGRVTYTVSMP
jgi:hypothetical protein